MEKKKSFLKLSSLGLKKFFAHFFLRKKLYGLFFPILIFFLLATACLLVQLQENRLLPLFVLFLLILIFGISLQEEL